MTKNVSALTARTQFGQILERVSHNRERFLVTKNGEAKAVILGIEDFLGVLKHTPKELAELQDQAHRTGADKLTLEDIEREVREVRSAKINKKYAAQGSL